MQLKELSMKWIPARSFIHKNISKVKMSLSYSLIIFFIGGIIIFHTKIALANGVNENKILAIFTIITTSSEATGNPQFEPTPTQIVPTATPFAIQTSQQIALGISPNKQPSDSNSTMWSVIKKDSETSLEVLPADSCMSTVDELNEAMNQYRIGHQLPTLYPDPTLCSIAKTRADQQLALGHLDGHAGFPALANQQQKYSTMAEVLFGGVEPIYGVHIVEWGWDRSLTGHKETISDPKWHSGCGGIAGYFAVFEFGN